VISIGCGEGIVDGRCIEGTLIAPIQSAVSLIMIIIIITGGKSTSPIDGMIDRRGIGRCGMDGMVR